MKTDTLDIVRKVFAGKDYPISLYRFMPITNLVPTFSCVMVERKTLLKCNFNTPQNAKEKNKYEFHYNVQRETLIELFKKAFRLYKMKLNF